MIGFLAGCIMGFPHGVARWYQVIGWRDSGGVSPYEAHNMNGHRAYTDSFLGTVQVVRSMADLVGTHMLYWGIAVFSRQYTAPLKGLTRFG